MSQTRRFGEPDDVRAQGFPGKLSDMGTESLRPRFGTTYSRARDENVFAPTDTRGRPGGTFGPLR